MRYNCTHQHYLDNTDILVYGYHLFASLLEIDSVQILQEHKILAHDSCTIDGFFLQVYVNDTREMQRN